MQFLTGLREFTKTPSFAAGSITNFRKYITSEMIREINDDLFRAECEKDDDDDSNSVGPADKTTESSLAKAQPATAEDEGEPLPDGSCVPAYIMYPTDINLLNEAREKLEGMIDALHPQGYGKTSPGHTGKRRGRRIFGLSRSPSITKRKTAKP